MPLSAEQRARLQIMGIGPVWVLRDSDASDQPAAVQKTSMVAMASDAGSSASSNTDSSASFSEVAALDWDPLAKKVASCEACGLCQTRTQTVFGVGDRQADWLLIGEAPGAEEDARGEPFVGQAGKLLDNMLRAVDLERGKNVYIANVLKCRPPNNRNPQPEEVERCSPYLQRQIVLIQPKVILVLGRFAAQTLLNTDASISSLRGKPQHYQSTPESRKIPVIVTYHPAYLLRTPTDKAKSWVDLCLAREIYHAAIQDPKN